VAQFWKKQHDFEFFLAQLYVSRLAKLILHVIVRNKI